MTQALEAVIAAPAKLPPDEQDALSALLVAEMDSEERWSDLFSQSQGLLAELAQQALLDHAAGKTQSLLEWSRSRPNNSDSSTQKRLRSGS
jgi:hypothetical protein